VGPLDASGIDCAGRGDAGGVSRSGLEDDLLAVLLLVLEQVITSRGL
jgi:hypothetical protein